MDIFRCKLNKIADDLGYTYTKEKAETITILFPLFHKIHSYNLLIHYYYRGSQILFEILISINFIDMS